MKKILIIIGISIFFVAVAVGAAGPTFNSGINNLEDAQRYISTCPLSPTDKPHEDAVWNLDSCYWFVDNPYVEYDPNYLENHDFNPPDNKLQNVLDNCDCQESGQTPCKLPRLSYQNDTHFINNNSCEWKERGFVSTTPFGHPRDTTGNYDHCFSNKTDPEYGVLIQNFTHILNPENCEWELENE